MKQVILVREDLSMSPGKAVAQGAHVSVLAARGAQSSNVDEWLDAGGKKITLGVEDKEELQRCLSNTPEGIPTAIIQDHGHTELESGTVTAGAIGPANEAAIDSVTGHLPLYTGESPE